MKLTIDNWSHKNIQEEIKDFTHVEKVGLAVFCVEKAIGIFESKHSNDNRPRLVIEAAKEFIKNPTEENKEKCRAAAYAAADAATVAVYAVYAAIYAAYATDALTTAVYTAYAAVYAVYADDAAADVKNNSLKQEIIEYIKELKGEKMTETTKQKTVKEAVKSVYTHELMVRGGVNTSEQYEPVLKVFSGQKFSVFINENGKEYVRKNSKVKFRLIDARTDEEKLIDDVHAKINQVIIQEDKDLACFLVDNFDITLK